MEELKKKAGINSFYLSLIYPGFGTLLLFIPGGDNELIATMHSGLVLLTLPVTIVGWFITYTMSDRPILLMLGIQFVFFISFWFIAYRNLLKKYKREERTLNKEQGET